MLFSKKTMGIMYAIGGTLLILAGVRDLFLPGFLSIRAHTAGQSAAGFHFAAGTLLFIIAVALVAKVKE